MNSQVTGTEIFWSMAAIIVLLLIVTAKAISVANHHAGAARAAAAQAASIVAQTQQQPARRSRRGIRLLLVLGVTAAVLWLASSMFHLPSSGAYLRPQARPTVTSPSPQPAPAHSAPAPAPVHTAPAPAPRSPVTGTDIVILVTIVAVTTIPIALARRGRDD